MSETAPALRRGARRCSKLGAESRGADHCAKAKRVFHVKHRLTTLQPRVRSAQLSRLPVTSAKQDHKALYNSREWREGRIEHLRANPCCKRCDDEGRVTEATVVDHKVPHQGNRELFFDRDNWESICKPHHDSDKQREEHEQGYR